MISEVDMLIDEYLVLFALSQGNSFFISNPLSIWRIHERNFSNANSKINTDKNKERRILKSMDAVLALLFSNSFSEDIQKLYLLKIKVNQLAVKEELDRKAITDILELWVYIINNIKTFKYNFLKIVKNYNILNRTLPTFMIKKLKNLKTNSLSKK